MEASVSTSQDIGPHRILREALARIQHNRPSQSLRAVAKRLGISPSYLSKILKGQSPLPIRLLTDIKAVFNLGNLELADLQRSLLKSIEVQQMYPKTGLQLGSSEFSTILVEDCFCKAKADYWLLEAWYYLPLLDLFLLKNFDGTPESIAEFFDLSEATLQQALHCLVEAGFLMLSEDGASYIRTQKKIRFPPTKSHGAVRIYHKSVIPRALEYLEESGPSRFEGSVITGLSVPGNSEKFEKSKALMEEALYRAAELLAGTSTSDQIYQINLKFLPLKIRQDSEK